MSRWAEALHGVNCLNETVSQLAALVGADHATVGRLRWEPRLQSRVAFAKSAGSGKKQFGSFYAFDVFGPAMRGAQNGSIWSMTELRAEEPALVPSISGAHLSEHGVEEILVVCLESRDDGADLVEFDYRAKPAAHNRTLLSLLGPELSSSWRRRLPGTAQKCIAQINHSHGRPEPQDSETSILHPDNPMGLSRSEFRICMMLREGMRANAIAEALSVTMPTVRSHLSKIFQKTHTSGQVDLVQAMLRDDIDEPAFRNIA